MHNTEVNTEIWIALREKWAALDAAGHTVRVEFNILKDPDDDSRDLAIDVAQNIDGQWFVQTVQRRPGEAYAVLGIQGLGLEQLVEAAGRVAASLTGPANTHKTCDDELHLFMKRLSPESGEISGHIVSRSGEVTGVRTNYQHYYVLNAILEKMSQMTREEYSGLELHRDRGESQVYFRFLFAL